MYTYIHRYIYVHVRCHGIWGSCSKCLKCIAANRPPKLMNKSAIGCPQTKANTQTDYTRPPILDIVIHLVIYMLESLLITRRVDGTIIL